MTLLPISSNCHNLQLPPVEKDDRLNLNVRTGSASTLYNSLVFTFGGLTIGLDIATISGGEVISNFQSNLNSLKSNNLIKYMSGELFYLNLIEKAWSRVSIPPEMPKPPARLFHEILALNNHLYLFGGLIINGKYGFDGDKDLPEIPKDLLVPANDLWEFDMEFKSWKCLYDLTRESPLDDGFVPTARYCHKMTTLNTLSMANKPDHFGILIAGGRNANNGPVYENLVFDLVDKQFIPNSFAFTLEKQESSKFAGVGEDDDLNIDYYNSVILNVNNQFKHYLHDAFQPSAPKDPRVDPFNGRNDDTTFKSDVSRFQAKESIVVYSPVKSSTNHINPLVSFKVSKSMKPGKSLPIHRNIDDATSNQIIPYNLRYPIAGLFGQNLIITGFLPNDFDISIFIFNRPTGKWSRLNVFCNHDYGSHRFWGGYAWQSHHKVVLIGNSVTSRTTSAVRYFSCLITVSLPITNILASSELAGGGHYHDEEGNRIYFDDVNKSTDDSTTDSSVNSPSEEEDSDQLDTLQLQSRELLRSVDRPLTPPSDSRRPSAVSRGSRGSVSTSKSPRAISFSEYVHYAAPTTNFTTIRSVFPPAAITLGRNFLDRFGDMVSDFEIISVNGDRIPVSMMVLIERWGTYFIELLARGYISAVEKFDQTQRVNAGDPHAKSPGFTPMTSLKSSLVSSQGSATSVSYDHSQNQSQNQTQNQTQDSDDPKHDKAIHLSLSSVKKAQKDAPLFRLPFQDSNQSLRLPDHKDEIQDPTETPPQSYTPGARKDSTSSFSSNSSSLRASQLQDIPPQLPLPTEPIPPIPSNPTSFRSSSRRSSTDMTSPRGSLIHTLTQLRNIPLSKSPRSSPFTSPRASVSQQGGQLPSALSSDLSSSPIPNLKPIVMTPGPSNTPGSATSSTNSVNSTPRGADGIFKKKFQEGDTGSTSSNTSDSNLERSTESVKKEEEAQDQDHYDPFDNVLLNFENLENGTFQMESSLIPRKLYIPFATTSVKAFCEYLYTGQIGNKWLLAPTTLDNLALAKHYKVPLLYDLISEVLYGIIGRRESHVVKKSKELKASYFALLKETNTPHDTDVEFPLDEYEGFMDTVDDGYLDMALLKKTLKEHGPSVSTRKDSVSKSSRKSSRRSSRRSSMFEGETKPEINEDADGEYEDGAVPDKDTDSSFENCESSTSDEEQNLGISYLDAQQDTSQIGPRSKSVFDRADIDKNRATDEDENNEDKEEDQREIDLSLTLEQLVSPVAPVPSIYIIDLIFEGVTLIADLKLVLRVNNVRQMSKLLEQFEIDITEKMDDVKYRFDERQRLYQARELANSRQGSSNNVPQVARVPLPRTGSSNSESLKLKAVPSTTSLRTVDSKKSEKEPTEDTEGVQQEGSLQPAANIATSPQPPQASIPSPHGPALHATPSSTSLASSIHVGAPLERPRTNSSIRTGLGSLTPFKPLKSERKENKSETNKDIDRRITKLIRKDEKMKQKAEKAQKVQEHQQNKEKKKQEKEGRFLYKRSTGSANTIPSSPTLGSPSPSFAPPPLQHIQSSSSLSRFNKDDDDIQSVTSGSSSKKKGLLHHMGLGHSKSKDQLEQPKLQRVATDSSSKKEKKHGFFGIKK